MKNKVRVDVILSSKLILNYSNNRQTLAAQFMSMLSGACHGSLIWRPPRVIIITRELMTYSTTTQSDLSIVIVKEIQFKVLFHVCGVFSLVLLQYLDLTAIFF